MQLSTPSPSFIEVLYELDCEPAQTLLIGELCAPAGELLGSLGVARRMLRETGAEDIYGTIRAIRAYTAIPLLWARQDDWCVIFNLRTRHTPEGGAHMNEVLHRLNAAALQRGDSFFLTYGRAGDRDQIERAYPPFLDFLECNRQYDPDLRFQSEWYGTMRGFSGEGG